jgi:hypothetical protein
MTTKNPDDSVHKEQSGADEKAAGTEDATHAEHAHDDLKEEPVEHLIEDVHEFDDIELPQVDYSGYTKLELADTLGLIIDNRPTSEIREDVDRIKVLFYKKLKAESDKRKAKFLEGGGKIEDYRAWVDPLEVQVKHLLDKYRE